MNDDKIFIQDFEGNSKKGLIFVDDDSDVSSNKMRLHLIQRFLQPQHQQELPILIPINGDG